MSILPSHTNKYVLLLYLKCCSNICEVCNASPNDQDLSCQLFLGKKINKSENNPLTRHTVLDEQSSYLQDVSLWSSETG